MKLPFFQLYPSDYMRDTRMLSLAAKGGWFDALCMLHGSSTRGTLTLPVVGWARVMGATVDQAEAVINELDVMSVADVQRQSNGNVTLSSRRMTREVLTLEQTRLRVENHRRNKARNAQGNADVTDNNIETINQKLELIQIQGEPSPAAPSVVGGAEPRSKRFSPPAPEEVTAYATEIGYPMDGQQWCDSYAQKGWMVGKAKMKDWKAAVRNWKSQGWKPNGQPNNARPMPAVMR